MKINAQTLKEFDEHIRAGRPQEVISRLSGFKPRGVAREVRLPLANVCRRVGLYPLGLRLLGRVIYPMRARVSAKATPEELAEYAVLLTRSGVHREALDLLARVDGRQNPQAYLYRAFAHFERWEFAPAVPLLEAYVAAPIAEYSRLVGAINLSYALIGVDRLDEAEPLLRKTIATCARDGYGILEANGYELLTRASLHSRDLPRARESLAEYRRILGAPGERLSRKWEAILAAFESNRIDALMRYRDSLTGRENSEYRREVDRYSLHVQFDEKRFHHLIFGTIYPGFRALMYRQFNRFAGIESLKVGPVGAPTLDLANARLDGRAILEAGGKVHALIEALMRDFYRPLRLEELFTELYVNERYDVFSSPNRMHQLIRRARTWIGEHRLPLTIDEQGGSYALRTTAPFALEVPLERRPIDIYGQYLTRLRGHYGSQEAFLAREARQQLGVSRTTFFRFVVRGVEAGEIERLTPGRYRIA